MSANEGGHMEEKKQTSYRQMVAQVIKTMWSKLDDPALTLESLAKVAMYSPFHFDRIFSAVTGIPPRQFLAAIRLEQAKEYLLTTDLPITEIGQRIGYSSFGTFSTRFAKLVGVSPQKFREHVESRIDDLKEHYKEIVKRQTGKSAGISGRVTLPQPFEGIICVGLFRKPIPMGKPVVCTMLFEEGSFWLPPVADGTYYLLSTAFRWDEPLEEYFLPRNTLRGRGSRAIRIVNGRTTADIHIQLRPRMLFDPPILISLPLLIAEFLDKTDNLRRKAN
jgi:AraC family transcriptional regulator